MLYRFGDLEFDDERVVLSRGGRTLEVEPKPLALLAELLRRHPQVVSSEELLECVWPDAVVTKASVARAVRGLRRVLGERAGTRAAVIRNVRGRGYGIASKLQRERSERLEPLLEALSDAPRLVGREGPVRLLGRCLRAVASGRGQVATITGEPGIGKTTLAEALRAQAERAGFTVAVGQATAETGAPALRPFVDVLEALGRALPDERVAAAAGDHVSVLARLAPAPFAAARYGRAADPPDEERAPRAAEATLRFITRVAAEVPLLLVVDDLQWADRSTCELFERLAREVEPLRLLLVGCHRPQDPEPGSEEGGPFDALLGRLGGLRAVRPPIELEGLDVDALAEIAERESEVALDARARLALRDRTGGNPFFALELARSGAFEDAGERDVSASHRVPPRIRTLVRARIEGFSAEVRELLRVAAVLGEPFTLPLMGRLLDETERAVLVIVDELEQAALIRERREQPGSFTFVHALVAEAIVETLGRAERVERNGRIALVLDELYTGRPDAPVEAIAHHYAHAVAAGDSLERAVEWACRAGDRARARLLFEDAVLHYRRAIEWLRADPTSDPSEIGELLVATGMAERRRGEPSAASECFWQACEIASAAGRADLLADAAWPLAAEQYRGQGAKRIQDLLEASLGGEPGASRAEDPAIAARLAACLARAQSYTSPFEIVDSTSRRAVELAREGEDLLAELRALSTRELVLAAEPLYDERAAISRDHIGLAIEMGQRSEEFMARIYRVMRLIQEADPAGIEQELEICQGLAREEGSPLRARAYLLDAQVLRCCWRGDVATADELMPALFTAMKDVDPMYAMMSISAKSQLIDRIADRIEPVDDGALRNALGGGDYALPRPYVCSLAVRLYEEGRIEEARGSFEYLSRLDYIDIQRDVTYLVTVVQLAELAHRFGDVERASLLAPLLLPFSGRYASGHTAAVRGAVDRYRGLLEWTIGDLDRADMLLAAAIETEVRMDAAPWEAMARADRARLALDGRSPAGRDLALRELDLAREALGRRPVPGMHGFVADQRARL